MKIPSLCFLALSISSFVSQMSGQTLFAPSGAVGSSSTANVGIGTSAPAEKLHVVGKVLAGQSISTAGGGYSFNNDGGYDTGMFSPSDGVIDFYNNANHAMRINAFGAVGIGTNNPEARLHVAGSPLFDGYMILRAPGWMTLQFLNQDAPPNQRIAEFNQYNGEFSARFSNDAYTDARTWLSVRRATNSFVVESVNFPEGNVGIGTVNPTHKLTVNGAIRAKEIIVDTGWADYVFEKDYRLAPLAEVEAHIEQKGHLPGIPSAAEITEHGVSMGEMQAKMMAKIEELTLHLIAQEKRELESVHRIEALERELAALRRP